MDDLAVSIEDAQLTGNEVGAGITLVSKVSGERTLQFSTALPRDWPVAKYHELVDKLSAVCERQESKFLLHDIERSILVDEDQMALAQEEIPEIEVRAEAAWLKAGKKGKFSLNDNERSRQQMLANNLHKLKGDIAKKKIAVKELREKIAKDT